MVWENDRRDEKDDSARQGGDGDRKPLLAVEGRTST